MSEATIQAGIKTALQAMDEFSDADIVINDWTIFDQYVGRAPYVIIGTSDDFESRQDTQTPNTNWNITLTLVEAFTEWKKSIDDLQIRRQAIIDKINSTNIRSAGGLEAVNIDEIRNASPILPRYDPYIPDEQLAEATPQFIYQDLVLVCEEF